MKRTQDKRTSQYIISSISEYINKYKSNFVIHIYERRSDFEHRTQPCGDMKKMNILALYRTSPTTNKVGK